MTSPHPVKRYSPAEYYALERTAEYKSDYYRGEIFAMAGGSARHSLITANVVGELRARLKGGTCRAYESNLRLKVRPTGLRCYPDVSVYCGPLERDEEDDAGETFVNPTLIVEVLSDSTEAYDRGFKAENYRRIESLATYLLVSRKAPHVEVYTRQADGDWLLHEARDLGAAVALPSIGVDLPLSEVYSGVDFEDRATADR